MIYYLTYYRPYEEKFLNFQEQVNEITVLIAAYPLFVFTEWVSEEDRRLDAGWYLIGCILLNIMFNITVLMYFMVKDTYRKCKRAYNISNAKALKEMKERKKREDELVEIQRLNLI